MVSCIVCQFVVFNLCVGVVSLSESGSLANVLNFVVNKILEQACNGLVHIGSLYTCSYTLIRGTPLHFSPLSATKSSVHERDCKQSCGKRNCKIRQHAISNKICDLHSVKRILISVSLLIEGHGAKITGFRHAKTQ